jgi:membrane-bound lytic murein transglycosylase B
MKEVKMNRREVVKMQRKVQSLQKALAEVGPLMRGSVVVIGTKNKQPYFSLNKDKKTRLIYLGKDRVEKAQEYSQNYKRLLAIVEEMTVLNMELLKLDAAL